MAGNVYVGKSGQLWFEVSREGDTIHLRHEYYSSGYPRSLPLPLRDVETVCGMRLIGTHTDFKTIQLTPPQGAINGQEEPQGAQGPLQGGHSEALQHSQSPLRWDDEAIQQSTQAFNNLPLPLKHPDFTGPTVLKQADWKDLPGSIGQTTRRYSCETPNESNPGKADEDAARERLSAEADFHRSEALKGLDEREARVNQAQADYLTARRHDANSPPDAAD